VELRLGGTANETDECFGHEESPRKLS
jgi:hypothetical protein